MYSLTPQDGDGELVARNLRTGTERRHARGRDPVLTADGRFVIFTIAPVDAELDKAKKDKKKPEDQPKPGLGIVNLETGESFSADRVKSFKVPEESSRNVAWLHEAPKPERKKDPDDSADDKDPARKKEKKKDPGTDLVIRDLTSGTNTTVGEVTDYAWAMNGGSIAYAVSSKTAERDGVYIRQPGGAERVLATGKGHYKGLAFDEAGRQIAFVSNRDEYEADAPRFELFLAAAGESNGPESLRAAEIVGSTSAGVPQGFAVSEHGRVQFSKDGSKLFFGTAPAPRPEPSGDAPEPLKVDLWHWKDPFLQSMQKVRADEDKKQTYLAVVSKDRRIVQLGSEEMPEVTIAEGPDVFLASSDVAYRQLVSWDSDYNDFYVVTLRDGSKKRLIQKSAFDAHLSPGGGYVLYYSDNPSGWHAIRLSDGKDVNLTARLGLSFVDEEWDTPDMPRSYGVAGWTEGDRSVLVYDRLRHLGAEAGRIGRADAHRWRRARSEDRVPLSAPGSGGAAHQGIRADLADGDRRADQGQRVLSRDARRTARQTDDGADCRRKSAKGEDRGCVRLHAVALRTISGPVGKRRLVRGCEEGDGRQPATSPVPVGEGGAHRLHQHGQQAAQGHAHQARRFRSREEVPAHGLYLRTAVAEPPLVRGAGSQPSHQPITARRPTFSTTTARSMASRSVRRRSTSPCIWPSSSITICSARRDRSGWTRA